MNNVDLNIKNYTLGELIDIFDLDDNYTIDDVNKVTTKYISLYKKNKSKEHVNFLLKARQILLIAIDTLEEIEEPEEIEELKPKNINNDANKNIENEDNQYQRLNDNILDDNNADNSLIIKKEEQINTKTHNLSVVRGNLNPNVKNTTSVILNIDSQFRPDLVSPSSNYSFDLAEPLNKVVSYSLINFEIQHCWYVIDDAYGTNTLLVDNSYITIQPGNYDINNLIPILNNNNYDISFIYNQNNNKISILNNSLVDRTITFYDNSGNFNTNAKFNYNLGWLLGFRNTSYIIQPNNTITTEGMVDLYGPKYLILSIDDYNHNHINKGMATMGENITKLNLPSYYSPDLSLNDPNFKFDFTTSTWVPSNLTITQAYTIQEIVAQRQNSGFNRYYGPNNSNVFGRIFLERKGGSNFGIIYNASSHLKALQRTFFGPVNIKRMNISLYNDKGQLMNLNNQDYSMALSVEQLYEY